MEGMVPGLGVQDLHANQGPAQELALRMSAARASIEGVSLVTLRAMRKIEKLDTYMGKAQKIKRCVTSCHVCLWFLGAKKKKKNL